MTRTRERYFLSMAAVLLSVLTGCATATPLPDAALDKHDGNAVVILPDRDHRSPALWKQGMSGILSALEAEGIGVIGLEEALKAARKTTPAANCQSSDMSCYMLLASYAGYHKAVALAIHSLGDDGVQGAILVFDAGYCIAVSTFVAPRHQTATWRDTALKAMTETLRAHSLSPEPDPRRL